MAETKQTWRINGQIYTHAQLLELRRQGFDPRKDQIVMSSITPRPEKKEESHKEEDSKEAQKGSDKLPTNFLQLKALAKEKGMEVTNSTKKEEIIKFLDSLK